MNDEWGTPDWVFQLAHKIEPIFAFDAACNRENCLLREQESFGDSLLVCLLYTSDAADEAYDV